MAAHHVADWAPTTDWQDRIYSHYFFTIRQPIPYEAMFYKIFFMLHSGVLEALSLPQVSL